MENILANLNIQPLKEPRGFMKVLQFVFSICAFATTVSYSSTFSFTVQCQGSKNDTVIEELITYPFRVDSIDTTYHYCNSSVSKVHIMGNFSSDSEFFVAIGVLAFLYSIAALILYCFLSSLYDNDEKVPILDCAIHVVFAFLWLAASSAWASGLTNLKMATSLDAIMNENKDMCATNVCTPGKELAYSKLVISIIFGFLNLFLWASNLWFLYKETSYFKNKMNMAAGNGSTQPAGTA
ncbi:hypothetical protein Pmani_011639 [Petrolisthes manimaculis]|uniref:MARVEL domain-containing protein n=1 Tax=Petrolisthes manimaculis TaxID=1843537 RepID=A0AAE1UBE3_9EUCA|nr:hypothetical protein Pmani_011639 [Petrolisthes manimaculis]